MDLLNNLENIIFEFILKLYFVCKLSGNQLKLKHE